MKRSLDFSALIQWSNTIGEIPISGRSSLLPKKVESKQKESADYFGLQDRHVWGPKHLAYYTSDLFGNELVKTSHMTELNAIVKEERKRLEKETASKDPSLDWGKISQLLYEKVKRRYLPADCFIVFSYKVERGNGTRNAGPWGKVEEAKLIELAKKYNEHQWVYIAEELGTNRTPIDCLCHYQQAFNVDLINADDWSTEEETMLKAAVDKLPGYTRKNWQVVANAVPGRTSYQ